MAGHSKWANIRFRKGAQDAKRGKLFTKLIREITVAARVGGGDADANPRLRTAIDKAMSQNMTKDTVERAIKRGIGEIDGAQYEEIRYEGYGPAGVAVMVPCTTDNKNRTVAEVRHTFAKHGGNLGTEGSVGYLFNKIGVITYDPSSQEDTILNQALEAGAEDVVASDDAIEVITTPEQFHAVYDKMKMCEYQPASAELTYRASNNIELDEENAEKVSTLLESLEDLDDVQAVYCNATFPQRHKDEE